MAVSCNDIVNIVACFVGVGDLFVPGTAAASIDLAEGQLDVEVFLYVKIAAEDAFKLCWEPSWFPPDGAALLNEDPVTISAPQTLEPVEGADASDVITEEPEPSEENPDPADGEEIPVASDAVTEEETPDEDAAPSEEEPEEGSEEEIE